MSVRARPRGCARGRRRLPPAGALSEETGERSRMSRSTAAGRIARGTNAPRKTAEEEIDEVIEEAYARKMRKRKDLAGEDPTQQGERCLYSWTCGPKSDGPCPHSRVCADWRRPIVPCAYCIHRKRTSGEGEGTRVECVRQPGRPVLMPFDGHCSEGVFDRYQDASRYMA